MGEPRRVVVRSVVVRTVLVVDDDDRILAACRRSLRLQGKTVFFARDAVTARHIARKERPDLAIVDLRLGNKQSGLDLLRVLKHDRAALKVVLVSGWMSLAVALAAVRAGADSFFAKPFSPREVLRHVENGTAPDLDLETTPSLERVEFEHIERVLADTNGNVAEAARRLGMYRQSLERKRRKRVPRT